MPQKKSEFDYIEEKREKPAFEWVLDGQPHIRGVAFWEWDLKKDFVRFSPEWENILQNRDYDYAKPGDQTWWRKRIHRDDFSAVAQMNDDIAQGKNDRYDLLFRLQRADGCWAWLLSRGTVTKRQNGKVIGASGIISDISFLRNDPKFQMAESVGSSAYHAMLENSPDMFVRMDRELFAAYVNPAVARYMNRERDQYYSYKESLDERNILPEHLDFLQNRIGRVFDERVTLREEVAFTDADGHEFVGEYSFWPEFDPDGKVIFAMTQFRDLSEQVKAERLARINEKRLEALNRLTLMDNAPEDAVLNFVMNSIVELTHSESAFILLPWGDSPFEGEMLWSEDHYWRMGRPDLSDYEFASDLAVLVTQPGGSICFRSMKNGDGKQPVHRSFNGQMAIMRCLITPAMEDERVACIAGVCNKARDYDEADRRQLETFINGAWLVIRRQRFMRELQRAKDAAEHANKVKDVFLANISHELRTPLNGMLSMLQLLELQSMTAQQREYVSAANESGKALLRIISDILDFSRMESGRMQLQKEIFNFKETVFSIMRLFKAEAIKKGLNISFTMDECIPACMIGDEARFRQILYNLAGNALKFTEQGEIGITFALLPEEDDGRLRFHISVRDTGIGIPAEKQGIIFEAFTQLDNFSTRRYAGTGLGLGIVKQLVGLMDGKIFIESQVGEGTTVHCLVTFDRCAAHELPLKQEKKAAPSTWNKTASMDILVAEDDDVGRFAIRSFLQRAGHRPLCVRNGRQALEALQLHHFDCLFTDIQMPDMDGLEVTRRIRSGELDDMAPSDAVRTLVAEYTLNGDEGAVQVDPDMIVAAVSAHTMSGDRERFLELGMNFYVSKPIRMDELGDVLADIGKMTRLRMGRC